MLMVTHRPGQVDEGTARAKSFRLVSAVRSFRNASSDLRPWTVDVMVIGWQGLSNHTKY